MQFNRGALANKYCSALGQPASTGESILEYCRKHGLDFQVQKASEDASLYWIGKPPQDSEFTVLFYLHGNHHHIRPTNRLTNPILGGGYLHAIQPGHIKFLQQCIANVKRPVSIAILDYTLTTQSPWPAQLQSAIAGTNFLLNDYRPSRIILGGDSAGGHLVLSLLSHILQPEASPCSASPVTLTEPFAGAFLMSPWVTPATSAPSYTRLAKRDHLTVGRVDRFTDFLVAWDKRPSLAEMEKDPFLSPLTAPQWWGDLGSVVRKLQIAVGTWEIFFDDNVAMARHLLREAKGADVCFVECEAAIHSGSVVDATLGIKDSTMSKAIWQWLNDELG